MFFVRWVNERDDDEIFSNTMKRSLWIAAGLMTGWNASAQETEAGPDLAQQLANPVASLISVPLQANFDFGIGVNDATRFTLNIQPVIPLSLNEEWNLIVRTIVPVIDAEAPAPGLRWLDLAADGSVRTGVSRVQGVAFSFDRDSAGYL